MSAFERTKQHVHGNITIINSWYDDRTENWRASAPLYAYLEPFAHAHLTTCSSRQEAVEQVSDLLILYFKRVDLSKKAKSYADRSNGMG
jgi:hypothetical protein